MKFIAWFWSIMTEMFVLCFCSFFSPFFVPPSFFWASAIWDFSACAGDFFFAPPIHESFFLLFINEQKFRLWVIYETRSLKFSLFTFETFILDGSVKPIMDFLLSQR